MTVASLSYDNILKGAADNQTRGPGNAGANNAAAGDGKDAPHSMAYLLHLHLQYSDPHRWFFGNTQLGSSSPCL
ncbi:hypothetical protein LINPERHAP1_LOCUS2778 [Linum perenne]